MTTLITFGVGRYEHEPRWEVADAARSRKVVEQLFTAHGATAQDWTLTATSQEIGGRLDKWAEQADEPHVVYWTGHGECNDDGYRLALADSTRPLTVNNSCTSDHWYATLCDRLRRRSDDSAWLVVIFDTCGSGRGAWDVWRRFQAPPANVAIVGTSDDGAAFSGAFADALLRAFDDFNGNDSAGVPVAELLRRLEADLEGPARQPKIHGKLWASAVLDPPPRAPIEVQATVDAYVELYKVLADSPAEIRNHFYAKAQGAELGEPAWHFVGRHDERREITAWLREARSGMYAVTGVAGAGKSALVGMLLATSDDTVTHAIEAIAHNITPPDERPTGVRFDAAVHLTGRTEPDVVTMLARALDFGDVETADQLVERVGGAAAGEAFTTILVDALDEARDPLAVARLLRRLASLDGVRILVGTRQSLHEDPDHPIPPDEQVLEALGADPGTTVRLQRDPRAITEYVTARLTARLPDLGHGQVTRVAGAVAASDQPFLFARLATHEVIADPAWARKDSDLADLLGRGHSGIFQRAMARLRHRDPAVEALLHALAYARGRGFPRTYGIWQVAARTFTDARVTDRSVAAALEAAAPYVMQDSEHGQAVYRLAHRSFTELYRRRDT